MNAKELKKALTRAFLLPGVGMAAMTLPGLGLWLGFGVSRGGDPPEPTLPGPVFLASPPAGHEFYFTRAIYSSGRGWGWGGRGSWATDYPKADRQFLVVIEKLLGLDAYDFENAVRLTDPELRRYPFLYALEVGRMALTQEEIHGLRDYLNAGGFLVIDDFWGTREWEVFSYNMRMVLPGRPMVELPLDHDLFHTFYEIDEIKQVPNVRQGRFGGPTWERDGYEPRVLGIHDDDGRLMVVINWNTDLGDAWEWAEDPFYPMEYSNFAYEMGANLIIYAMSH
jgi:hypothetical protein